MTPSPEFYTDVSGETLSAAEKWRLAELVEPWFENRRGENYACEIVVPECGVVRAVAKVDLYNVGLGSISIPYNYYRGKTSIERGVIGVLEVKMAEDNQIVLGADSYQEVVNRMGLTSTDSFEVHSLSGLNSYVYVSRSNDPGDRFKYGGLSREGRNISVVGLVEVFEREFPGWLVTPLVLQQASE